MVFCNQCGNEVPNNMRFCTECGAAVGQESAPPIPRTVPLSAGRGTAAAPVPALSPAMPTERLRPGSGPLGDDFGAPTYTQAASGQLAAGMPSQTNIKLLIGVIGAVAVVAIAVAVYFALSQSPGALAGASLKSAVQSGRFVTLGSDDAYTYYHQVKGLDPNNKVLAQVAPQVLSGLKSMGDELFARKASVQRSDEATPQDWARAVRAFEWARELDPSDQMLEARRRFALGEVAKGEKRLGDAERNFLAAAQTAPAWAMPQNSLGLLEAVKKHYEEALRYYQKAAQMEPNWEIPCNNMGSAYYGLKDFQNAEYWYRQAIQKNPNWGWPHRQLGYLYRDQSMKDQAITEWQTALNLDPNGYSINVNELQRAISKLQR